MIKVTDELVGRFVITDDVNSQNIEFIKNFYSKSTLRIDKRFDVPQSNYVAQELGNGKTHRYVKAALDTLEDLMKKGQTSIVQGETPFRNFKIKVTFWCSTLFKDAISGLDADEQVKILVNNTVSKHEYIFLYWLYKCGADVVVITKDIKKAGQLSEDIQLNIFNTNENLEYRKDVIENTAIVVSANKLKSLNDIEDALYNKNSVVKVLVDGVGNYIDTCDFYGRLYITSEQSDDFKLCIGGFESPAQGEVNQIPRFKRDEHNYILQTILMFVNVKDKSKNDKLRESIETEFNTGANAELKGTMLYNKLVYCVLVLNKLLNSPAKHVVFYGAANKNDTGVLRVLSRLDFISTVVLMPDKTTVTNELIQMYNRIELESSMENLEMPKVDSRANARTTGAVASRIAQETLYDGSLLGMYKPGQFCTCDTKLFSTAYEEIELWWNKEMYNRPQFSAVGIKAILPVMLKVINGVPNNYSHAPYMYTTQLISKFLYGNTLLCRNVEELRSCIQGQMRILRATDINGTEFKDQKPFYSNGRLNKELIKRGINYKYGFLSPVKQDFILSKIEDIINTDKIAYDSKERFTDDVLNTLLNMDSILIRMIQWFEFYTDNPNMVLVMPNEQMLDTKDAILILFMHLIGFDILVFVPTRYRSLEGLFTAKMQYEQHEIGYAEYSIDTQYMKVDKDKPVNEDSTPQKKKSLFSKLLGNF